MAGLIDAEFAAARKGEPRDQAITLILHRLAGDPVLRQFLHEQMDVVAHEGDFMHIVLIRGMHGHFRGRQAEDEPAVAHIHIRQIQHIAQKRAIRFGVRAVDDECAPVNKAMELA